MPRGIGVSTVGVGCGDRLMSAFALGGGACIASVLDRHCEGRVLHAVCPSWHTTIGAVAPWAVDWKCAVCGAVVDNLICGMCREPFRVSTDHPPGERDAYVRKIKQALEADQFVHFRQVICTTELFAMKNTLAKMLVHNYKFIYRGYFLCIVARQMTF